MSANYMLMGVDDLSEQDSPSPPPERSTTPTRPGISQTRASAARRASVTVACERCRRRKIRCSGLPGPCTSCAKFRVACLDPGKRKQRSSSFLEDRIRALETLAAKGAQLDPAAVHSLGSDFVHTSGAERTVPGPLHIQTTDLANQATFDDSEFYSVGGLTTDTWSYPATPAHSDMGPEVHSFWGSSTVPTTLAMDSEPNTNFIASLHRRAHTFPDVPSFNQPPPTTQDAHNLLSPVFSDLPSIQITSHDGSRSPSPNLNPMDSDATFTLPFRDSFPTLGEPAPQRTTRTPPILHTDFTPQDTNMDYYGDFLSPLDRPPVLARRPSLTPSLSKPGTSHVSEWTSRVSSPTQTLIFNTPPKRRHTTCSIPRTPLTAATKLLAPELSWMLSSPRTTNYLTKYFSTIHNEYPFLSKHDLLSPTAGTSPLPPAQLTESPLRTYTRLMTAAIGALLHHQSRDISARYVRHAMTLSADSNLEGVMFTSIQGIHAAMLLAVYLLLEGTMEFEQGREEEDVSHPEVNLWLWSARVAMGCIDLGLHQMAGPEKAEGGRRGKMEMGRGYQFDEFEQGDLKDFDYADMKREDEEYDVHHHDEGNKRAVSVSFRNLDYPSPPDDEGENDQLTTLYINTFRSAFLLDRRISDFRRRPTAFHVGDIDERLLEGLI